MTGARRFAPLIAASALFALASQSGRFSGSSSASSLLAEDAAPPTAGSSSSSSSLSNDDGAAAAEASSATTDDAALGNHYDGVDDYRSEYRGATDSPFEIQVDLRQYVVAVVSFRFILRSFVSTRAGVSSRPPG